jgi:hypothetical protein
MSRHGGYLGRNRTENNAAARYPSEPVGRPERRDLLCGAQSVKGFIQRPWHM